MLLEHQHWLLRRSDGTEERVTVQQSRWDGQQGLRATLEGVSDRDAATAAARQRHPDRTRRAAASRTT